MSKNNINLGIPEESLKMDFKLLYTLSKDGDVNAKSKLREGLVNLASQGRIDELRFNLSHINYIMQEEGDLFLTYLIEQLGSDYQNPHRDFEKDLWESIGLVDLLPEVKETRKKFDWYGLRILAEEKFEHCLSLAIKKGGSATLKPILQFLNAKVPNTKDPKDWYNIYEYVEYKIANLSHMKKYYENLEEAKQVVIEFVKKNPISSNFEGYKYWYFMFVRSFLEDDFWKVIDNGDKFLELARIWYKEPRYYEIGYMEEDDMDVDRGIYISILIEKNQITELWLDFDQSDLFIEDYNKIYGEKSEDMRRLISSLSSLKKIYVYALLRLDQVYDDKDHHTLEFFQFLVNLKTLRMMFDEFKQKGIEIEYIEL